ncbi:amidase family protein [Devosia ginsengisoli]|uniref:amidase family protein n=1 Tax=Devosia ginsengisoli TaxID=400770 RepID=UPI0026EE0337|nr:amidase family protein [Devosia ginsengisoli]MCR6669795.1 amidase [Devosia ginsengisoli]
MTRAVATRGRAMPAHEYITHLQTLQRETRRIAGFFQDYDIWLTPTLAAPPHPTGTFSNATTDVDAWLESLPGVHALRLSLF